jgi:hypothetical protein
LKDKKLISENRTEQIEETNTQTDKKSSEDGSV